MTIHTQFSGKFDVNQILPAQELASDLLFRMPDSIFLSWILDYPIDHSSSEPQIQIPYLSLEGRETGDSYLFNYNAIRSTIFKEGKRRLAAPRITQTMVVVDMKDEPLPYNLATATKCFIDEFVKIASTQAKEPTAFNKDDTLNRDWVEWYSRTHSVDTRAAFIAGAVLVAGAKGIDLNKYNYHFYGNAVCFNIKPEFQEFSS